MSEKDWTYTVTFERAAGVGKTDGFKVTANSDISWGDAMDRAKLLYEEAIGTVQANYPVLNERIPKGT